jgi:dTDP-4-amino-4,6-dideoxygalactose transaminase
MDAVPLKVQPAVPMVDLQAQFASIDGEIRAAIDEVLAAQHFILGPQLATLEQDVARLCNRRSGIGVASGTDALLLALRASGIGHGDDVIVPAFTFIATASVVSALGARPVFADIEPRTFNLDPAQLESKITSKTRAIIAVHLYGLPAEMDPILAIANRRRLRVIEDNAQAIGASYKQRKTGSLGEVGCLSFYPSKNLGAYGDAGMIVTDSEELAARLKMLRHHGQSRKYVSDELGWNSRLDEIQAAVLRVKLRHLEQWTAARQAHASRYTELLSGIRGLVTPTVSEGCTHVFHQYTIRVPDRDRVQRALAERGIASTVCYPVPLHLQPLYGALGYKRGSLPEAERAAAEALSLPMYAELVPQQIEHVAEVLADTLGG